MVAINIDVFCAAWKALDQLFGTQNGKKKSHTLTAYFNHNQKDKDTERGSQNEFFIAPYLYNLVSY